MLPIPFAGTRLSLVTYVRRGKVWNRLGSQNIYYHKQTGTWVSRRPQQDGSESIFSNWYEHQGRKGPIFATAINEGGKSLEIPPGYRCPQTQEPTEDGAVQRKAEPSEEDGGGESPDEDAAGSLDAAISETTVDFPEAGLG